MRRTRGATLAIMAGVLLLSTANFAWAAKPPAKAVEETGPRSYFIPYALVIFCVALGVLVVLRPVGREGQETGRPADGDEEP